MSGIKKPFFDNVSSYPYFKNKPCSICGTKEGKRFVRWVPTSWLRGDDEADGVYCEKCRKKKFS